MNDLISRRALLAEYDKNHVGPPGGARRLIESAPAVEATPVARGKWIEEKLPMRRNGYIKITCSICGRSPGNRHTAFCAYCGAKMDGREARHGK